jgi:hypothetical protein
VGSDKEIVGKAADEFSGRVEFHQRMPAAMEYVDMPFRIHGDTAGLDKIFAGSQLKEIWNCLVIQLGHGRFRARLPKCGIA